MFHSLLWVAAGLWLAWAVLALLRDRRRRRQYALLAGRLRLNYRPGDALDLPTRYRRLVLFQHGHNRRASHVVSGPTRHGAASCLRYDYDVGSGANREGRTWGVAVIESEADLDDLAIVPPVGSTHAGAFWADVSPPEPARADARDGAPSPSLRASSEAGAAHREWWSRATSARFPTALEVRGGLIAVYSPGCAEAEDFRQLMVLATEAAGRLVAGGGEPCPDETIQRSRQNP